MKTANAIRSRKNIHLVGRSGRGADQLQASVHERAERVTAASRSSRPPARDLVSVLDGRHGRGRQLHALRLHQPLVDGPLSRPDRRRRPAGPVGHGIGMAIGVQLARPAQQVVTVIGDGGIGIGGWDMETAAKYRLPIVAVLWNNSSWGPSFEQMPILKGRTDPFDMLPDIRYDRIFAELGCHGEHVEKPDRARAGPGARLSTPASRP